MRWVFIHLPHLLPPALGFIFLIKVGFWAADQPPQQLEDDEVEVWRAERERRKALHRRPVRRAVARLGVLALVPLFAAIVTGLFIYTWNIRDDRPSSALIWTHTAISVLALVLTTWKVLIMGRRRLRRDLSLSRPQSSLSSLVLLALGVPLVATGIWLLVRPSGSSTTDYVHLIVSVWWTLILQWHLWRYLSRALGATFRDSGTTGTAAGTSGTSGIPPRSDPPRSAPAGL
jgi:hypothetical protein